MHAWVQHPELGEDAAFRFDMPAGAVVSDLLLKAASVFETSGTPASWELTLRGTVASNRDEVQEATYVMRRRLVTPTKASRPVTPRRRGVSPPVRRSSPPTAVTPRRAAAPNTYPVVNGGEPNDRDEGQADAPMPAGHCVFKAAWGNHMCDACGLHRNHHNFFEPSSETKQSAIVEHLRARSPAIRTPRRNQPLWEPPQTRTGSAASPVRAAEVEACGHFRAEWGRPTRCVRCGLQQCLHSAAPSPPKTSPVRGRTPPSVKRRPLASGAPDANLSTSVGSPLRHDACDRFVPLWNRNDMCSSCYRHYSLHANSPMVPRPRSGTPRRRPHGAGAEGGMGHRLPWTLVMAFCVVDDLFTVATVSKSLARQARKLLRPTMEAILNFEADKTHREALICSLHSIADVLNLADGHHCHLLRACEVAVGRHDAGASPEMTVYKDFEVRLQLLTDVSGVHHMNLGREFAEHHRCLASIRWPPDVAPLAMFLVSLWAHRKVRVAAAMYLAQPMLRL